MLHRIKCAEASKARVANESSQNEAQSSYEVTNVYLGILGQKRRNQKSKNSKMF